MFGRCLRAPALCWPCPTSRRRQSTSRRSAAGRSCGRTAGLACTGWPGPQCLGRVGGRVLRCLGAGGGWCVLPCFLLGSWVVGCPAVCWRPASWSLGLRYQLVDVSPLLGMHGDQWFADPVPRPLRGWEGGGLWAAPLSSRLVVCSLRRSCWPDAWAGRRGCFGDPAGLPSLGSGSRLGSMRYSRCRAGPCPAVCWLGFAAWGG